MLTVAVLGAVEARWDGVQLSVPTGKTSELLARLALDAGSRVRVDALLDDLWPAGAGRNTLQSKVSQLRRALGDKDLVVGEEDTYRLAVEPVNVDAIEVVHLARRASEARQAGDATTALGTLVPILSDARLLPTELGRAVLGTGVAGEFWPIIFISVFLTGVYGAVTEVVLLVAFAPGVLARPIARGATTLGIPIGLGVILLAIVLTGLYVRRANATWDEQVDALVRDFRA